MFDSFPGMLLFSVFGIAGLAFIIIGFSIPLVWMVIVGFVIVIALIIGIVSICKG